MTIRRLSLISLVACTTFAASSSAVAKGPLSDQLAKPFRDCADCPEMVVIAAGRFIMGSPPSEPAREDAEGPQHRVTFARPFAMGKNTVTFEEWDRCVAAGGCKHKPVDEGWGRGRRPVINVSWDDVQEYVKWLSQKTGKAYRLPSEAEWEYSARAGTTTRFYTGNCVNVRQANYLYYREDDNNCGAKTEAYLRRTAEVGTYPANRFGLNDMIGNVSQWVEDNWNDNYSGAPSDGTAWTEGDYALHVLRGGSWVDTAEDARAAYRFRLSWVKRENYLGFRVARTLP